MILLACIVQVLATRMDSRACDELEENFSSVMQSSDYKLKAVQKRLRIECPSNWLRLVLKLTEAEAIRPTVCPKLLLTFGFEIPGSDSKKVLIHRCGFEYSKISICEEDFRKYRRTRDLEGITGWLDSGSHEQCRNLDWYYRMKFKLQALKAGISFGSYCEKHVTGPGDSSIYLDNRNPLSAGLAILTLCKNYVCAEKLAKCDASKQQLERYMEKLESLGARNLADEKTGQLWLIIWLLFLALLVAMIGNTR